MEWFINRVTNYLTPDEKIYTKKDWGWSERKLMKKKSQKILLKTLMINTKLNFKKMTEDK